VLLSKTLSEKTDQTVEKNILLQFSSFSIKMACIDQLKKELKKEFPSIDKDLQNYIESEQKK
jgi:hypothetical protein